VDKELIPAVLEVLMEKQCKVVLLVLEYDLLMAA
jgi:hypothetical protein